MQNGNDKNYKKIYFAPDNLTDLVKTMKNCKNYRICFDDINYLDVFESNDKHPADIYKFVYTGFVQELSVLKRSERYFEVGMGLKINEILNKCANTLPSILIKALKESGVPNIRNIMTIGGLLCGAKIRNSLYAALSILNAKVEIYSSLSVGTRILIPLAQLCRDNGIMLLPGEMVTKIRIPYEEYDTDYYGEVFDKGKRITFVGTASIFKNTISICKFAIGNFGDEIIREVEIENGLVEQKLPIPDKILEGWKEKFTSIFTEKYTSFSPYVQKSLINMFTEFLGKL